jgi:hypothetical protein
MTRLLSCLLVVLCILQARYAFGATPEGKTDTSSLESLMALEETERTFVDSVHKQPLQDLLKFSRKMYRDPLPSTPHSSASLDRKDLRPLVIRLASRYGVQAATFWDDIKATDRWMRPFSDAQIFLPPALERLIFCLVSQESHNLGAMKAECARARPPVTIYDTEDFKNTVMEIGKIMLPYLDVQDAHELNSQLALYETYVNNAVREFWIRRAAATFADPSKEIARNKAAFDILHAWLDKLANPANNGFPSKEMLGIIAVIHQGVKSFLGNSHNLIREMELLREFMAGKDFQIRASGFQTNYGNKSKQLQPFMPRVAQGTDQSPQDD